MTLRRDQPTGFAVCSGGPRPADERARELAQAPAARPVADERHEQRGVAVARVAVGVVRDVRVLVGVDRRGDRHVVGVVGVGVEGGGGGDRLAVRAHEVPEARGQARQRAGLAAAQQQVVRPERPAGEDDAAGAHRAAVRRRAPGASRVLDDVARRTRRRTERPHVDDPPLGLDPRAGALGEPEVVLHQRVLRADAAAEDALPAAGAAGAPRALAAEVRVLDLHAGLAHEDRDRRRAVAARDAEVLRERLHQPLARPVERRLDDAEHPARRGVVRREVGAPVAEVRPLPVAVERVGVRHVRGVGPGQRAAADAHAGEHVHVPERA